MKQFAIRDDAEEKGFFSEMFGNSINKYEKELIRREKKRIEVSEKVKRARVEEKLKQKNYKKEETFWEFIVN